MNQGSNGPMSGGGTSPMPAPNPAAAAAAATVANSNNNAPAPAGLSYDISSFADPLQAQALQLTASAGLTSLLGQQQQQQQMQAPGAAAMQSPLHSNPRGFQPIAPAGTATAAGGTPTAPLGHHHHHHNHQTTNAAHLTAFLTPGALATAAAAGHQQQGVPAPVVNTAGGAAHPGLMFSNPAAAAVTAGGAAPGTTPGNPNANGAAAIALIMQQLQHAGVTASPLLLQQLAGPLTQATFGQQQQQQQQQQQVQQQQQQSMIGATPASTIIPGVPAIPSASSAPSGMTKDASDHASKRARYTSLDPPLSSAGVPPIAATAPSSAALLPPSSSHNYNAAVDGTSDPGPPKEASQADLQKMTPAERRRYERNLREQQRSYRISQQIKELRDVLAESNVPFKPNKYSILLSVVDYIKQLQTRAIMLDSEHTKLISTIRQTNEMVSSGKAPTGGGTDTEMYNAASTSESEGDALFVKGLDYRSVFEQCPAALGIAALDGRILECNTEFQTLLGFPRDELLKQSLFNLVQNHQDIFRAMAQMLKSAEEPAITQVSSGKNGDGTTSATNNANNSSGNGGKKNEGVAGSAAAGAHAPSPGSAPSDNEDSAIPPVSQHRFWTGPVTSKRNVKLFMNITLTLGDNGTPKFFSCAVTNTT